jgi:hypothetical protein
MGVAQAGVPWDVRVGSHCGLSRGWQQDVVDEDRFCARTKLERLARACIDGAREDPADDNCGTATSESGRALTA